MEKYRQLKEELGEAFKKWVSELEKTEGWGKYEEKVKTLFPLGYEKHPMKEGINELEHWYFWHGRDVKNIEDFKKFVEEFIEIVYGTFQSNEYYKDLGLNGFLLKMRQGELFNIDNNMLFSVPVSENIRGIYKKGYERSYDKLEADLIGLLDCRDNKFILEHYRLDIIKRLLPEFKDEYKSDTSENREIVKEQYNINFMNELFSDVNDLICRFKSDRFCEGIENKRLIVKDINADYQKKYDDIQKLAMGINNYIYLSFKRMENQQIYKTVINYLETGLNYLHNLVYESEEKIESHKYKEFMDLVKNYSNIKDNVDELIEGEIKSAVEGKASVYVNDMQFKEVYCYLSSGEHAGVIRGKHDYRGTLLSEVETLKYGRKEIFNRKEAVERLGSFEFQAGINGLIFFVRNHFERYDTNGIKQEEIKNGDLIYTKNKHFGIVQKGKIYLDNGKQESLDQAVICIKENELNKGLKVMRDYIKIGREKENQEEKER